MESGNAVNAPTVSKLHTKIPIGIRRDYRSSIHSIKLSKSTDRLTYTWRNLNVWTSGTTNEDAPDKCQRSKHLLKNVTGVVRPGELLAILGASGAGKSTMLNVLNFRNSGKLKVTGERAVNGVTVGPDSLTSVSAYIQQDDLFIGSLTVKEHLIFQARVRMHSHISYKSRLERVEQVIIELGLSDCADTQIGHPGRIKGISGGEMKRLSFASEVLTDPPLLFCDEPTSGLDSYMSGNVVSVLKGLSAQGKTILCTIHQPSSQIFEMFDRVLLMAEGRVAFMGETSRAIQFFKENGYPCPANYNPSDFYIKTLAIEPGEEVQCRERVARMCDSFEKSEDGRLIDELTTIKKRDHQLEAYLKKEAKLHFESPYKASWCEQFTAVLWRSWISNLKDPNFIRVKFIQCLVMSLTVGVFFMGQKFNQAGIQNINGANFNVMINISFGNAVGTVYVFCSELSLFLREHFNGMYRTDVYFLAKMLAEFPFYVLFPTMTVFITYFLIGLQLHAEAFLITLTIYILVANCAVSIGYLVSCLSSSGVVAATMASSLILPFVLAGGLFLNAGTIPMYLIWTKYISWFYYGNEALTIVQWRNVGLIECAHRNQTECGLTGQHVIRILDFNEDNLLVDIFALVGLVFIFRLFAYFALLRKTMRRS